MVHGEGDAIRRRRADQRRAAHLHDADRMRRLLDGGQPDDGELVGQPGLIDDLHRPAVVVPPDAAVGDAVDFHAAVVASRERGGNKADGVDGLTYARKMRPAGLVVRDLPQLGGEFVGCSGLKPNDDLRALGVTVDVRVDRTFFNMDRQDGAPGGIERARDKQDAVVA